VSLPELMDTGDLPEGVHTVGLDQLLLRFGEGSAQRRAVAGRLARIYHLAVATGAVARFIVFGSFVTAKPEPNDVDVFLVMEDTFDAAKLTGEVRLLFDHLPAQAFFGASVFWLRRLAALGGEQAMVQYWQVIRGGGRRGIIEIIPEQP
jgi:hypothetical protein